MDGGATGAGVLSVQIESFPTEPLYVKCDGVRTRASNNPKKVTVCGETATTKVVSPNKILTTTPFLDC